MRRKKRKELGRRGNNAKIFSSLMVISNFNQFFFIIIKERISILNSGLHGHEKYI